MAFRAPTLVAVTAAATAAYGDLVLADATSAAYAVTLPAVTPGLDPIMVKKTDSSGNAVTVTRAGTSTIDGATTYALASQYKSVTLVCDGTNWLIVAAV